MQFHIGTVPIQNKVILAPMAGITDAPFRRLCRRFGAGLAVSEMVTSDMALYASKKTIKRLDFTDDLAPISVQILGNEPKKMAEAAKYLANKGVNIIDINMGCPAKKVLKKAAGSALMQDEILVSQILENMVQAVDIPVTLKIRTGWDRQHKNAPKIAKIAEDSGIAALTVHGRTRACKFSGKAEYHTIKKVVDSVRIPVIANGDINSPQKAQAVLQQTNAQAVMLGRGAQGNPWLFEQVIAYLKTGQLIAKPSLEHIQKTMLDHCDKLYLFYGENKGVQLARKHMAWYSQHFGKSHTFRHRFNMAKSKLQQQAIILNMS